MTVVDLVAVAWVALVKLLQCKPASFSDCGAEAYQIKYIYLFVNFMFGPSKVSTHGF